MLDTFCCYILSYTSGPYCSYHKFNFVLCCGQISSGRYDHDDNFTVVIQPFMRGMSRDTPAEDLPDYSYTTPDCIHFNQKGHAIGE